MEPRAPASARVGGASPGQASAHSAPRLRAHARAREAAVRGVLYGRALLVAAGAGHRLQSPAPACQGLDQRLRGRSPARPSFLSRWSRPSHAAVPPRVKGAKRRSEPLTREDINTLAGCGASRLVGLDRIRSCGGLSHSGDLATAHGHGHGHGRGRGRHRRGAGAGGQRPPALHRLPRCLTSAHIRLQPAPGAGVQPR